MPLGKPPRNEGHVSAGYGAFGHADDCHSRPRRLDGVGVSSGVEPDVKALAEQLIRHVVHDGFCAAHGWQVPLAEEHHQPTIRLLHDMPPSHDPMSVRN